MKNLMKFYDKSSKLNFWITELSANESTINRINAVAQEMMFQYQEHYNFTNESSIRFFVKVIGVRSGLHQVGVFSNSPDQNIDVDIRNKKFLSLDKVSNTTAYCHNQEYLTIEDREDYMVASLWLSPTYQSVFYKKQVCAGLSEYEVSMVISKLESEKKIYRKAGKVYAYSQYVKKSLSYLGLPSMIAGLPMKCHNCGDRQVYSNTKFRKRTCIGCTLDLPSKLVTS